MGRGLLVRIRWFQLPNKERQRVRAQSGPPVKIWGMGTLWGLFNGKDLATALGFCCKP